MIRYKDEKFLLVDDFMDIGFMAENFKAKDIWGNKLIITRTDVNKSAQLFICFPDFDNGFFDEILALDALLLKAQVDLKCHLLLAPMKKDMTVLKNRLTKFMILVDYEDEFGLMYGTKIIDGIFRDKLTKALFLISKDGAIFYMDMPTNLEDKINVTKLIGELNKAYATYTGVGCHG